jgi:hypothetical protein
MEHACRRPMTALELVGIQCSGGLRWIWRLVDRVQVKPYSNSIHIIKFIEVCKTGNIRGKHVGIPTYSNTKIRPLFLSISPQLRKKGNK